MNPASIIHACCLVFQVTEQQLCSRCKQVNIVEARHAAMFLMRRKTDLRLKQIADSVGCMNHAAVIHANKSFRDKLDTEAPLRAKVLECEQLSFVNSGNP